MSDRLKTALALILFVIAVLLPVVPLAALVASLFDWIELNPWVAGGALVVAFMLPFTLGAGMLFWVKDPSWITVYLPYLFGAAYTFLPDLIPFSVDDAAAMTAGAIFSAWLAIRKNPAAPRWVLLPLMGAAIYTFFGGALPGPIDEALVDLLALLIAGYGSGSGSPETPELK
jgi:hypothetical protein